MGWDPRIKVVYGWEANIITILKHAEKEKYDPDTGDPYFPTVHSHMELHIDGTKIFKDDYIYDGEKYLGKEVVKSESYELYGVVLDDLRVGEFNYVELELHKNSKEDLMNMAEVKGLPKPSLFIVDSSD